MDSKVNQGLKEVRWVFRRDATPRTAGAITKTGGGYAIADTATTAQVGDIYRPETATTAKMVNKEYKIIAASTNSFTIASKDLPVVGDTFYVMAFITPRTDDKGGLTVTSSSGPTQYVYNGSDIEVSLDTSTAVNSRPLPVWYVNSGGSVTNLATLAEQQTQTTALGTLNTSVNTLLKPADTLAGVTLVGTVSAVTAITNALPAGNNNIGDVDILSIAAGDNNIGNVDIVTMPSIPAGTNNIGDVDVLSFPANTAFNLNQVGGAAIQTNGGNRSTSTMTITICDNQPAVAQNVTQINTQTVGAGQGQATAGTMRVTIATEDTATVTSVADSASSGQLLASTSTRQGASFFNNSTEALYLKYGVTASATDFSVKIAAGGYFELPGPVIYTGRIDGIWAANASGAVLITEW